MKQNIIRTVLACMLALCMIFGSVIVGYADSDTDIADKKMAHNIYTAPSTSKTSGRYNTFTIDFYGEQTPNYTYWALANFSMFLSPKTKLMYRGINGGGAYSGLQNTSPSKGKVAILSFWEYFYTEGGEQKSLRATRIFPEGTSNFGGEGEGTNCIRQYSWKDKSWYRMVLHCWEDLENGTTFAGQWVCDLSTGEWFLNAYFDTHLYDSYFQGNMGLFQENYIDGIENWTKEREFRVKNLYVNDSKDGQWKSLNGSTLSFGYTQENKMGVASFGTGSDADGEYFWGKAGGLAPGQGEGNYVAAQQEYLANLKQTEKSNFYTIQQPETPTLGSVSIDQLKLEEKNDKWTVSWELGKTSTPQCTYKVELIDNAGKVIYEKEASRPEETSVEVADLNTDAFKCRTTITDIFGSSAVIEKATAKYTGTVEEPTVVPGETTSPEPTAPITTAAPETTAEEEETDDSDVIISLGGINIDTTGLIIGLSVVAVVVVGGVIATVLIITKKKKQQ